MTNEPKTIEVIAPKSAKYISDVFPDGLPKNCILDKVTTGCGATYSALTSLCPTVIAVPTRNLVLDKVIQEQYKPFNILGVSSDFKFSKIPDGCNKIICTYESLAKISKHIDISKWDLVIDEMHTIHRMIGFALKDLIWIQENYNKFNSYCFVSATVPRRELLLSFLKDLDIVRVKWNNPQLISFEPYFSSNIREAVLKIIYEHHTGIRKGTPYFFYNSVRGIASISKAISRSGIPFSVVCSRSTKTKEFLRKYGITPSNPGTVSDVNFITSTAFEGCDWYDEDGVTYIVSDSRSFLTRYSLTTTIPQIAGRIRNSKYGDTITVIFNGDSPLRFDTIEKLESHIEECIITAKERIQIFNEYTKKNLRGIVVDMLRGSLTDPYVMIESESNISIEDLEFLTVDDIKGNTSLSLYEDARLMDIEEWELAQTNIYFNGGDASIRINREVNKIMDTLGVIPGLTEAQRKFFKIRNHSINKILEMYVIDKPSAISMDPEVCYWIEKYGVDAVRTMGIRSRIKDRESKEEAAGLKRLKHRIISKFKVGNFYSRQEIKEILESWGLEKPSATDISKFLDMKAAKVGNANGFKILDIKKEQ